MKAELPGQLLFEEKALLWIYIFSFVFDYKGQEGGSLPQYIMAGLSIAAGTGFILFKSRRRKKKTIKLYPNLKKITILWWFYLLSTVLTALIAGVVFDRYIRILFPLLLCGISFLIICKFQKRLIDPNEIIKPLLFASLIAVLWKIYYATQVANIDMYNMRYQILSSGGIVFLLAYVFAGVINREQLSMFYIIMLCIIGICSLLSITRSLIILIFFMACGYFWIALNKPFHTNIKRTLLLVTISILALIPAWYIADQLRPGFYQDWTNRIFHQYHGGMDITLLTRLAEWSGQIRSLTENMSSLIFGRGLGSEYFWDYKFFFALKSVYSWNDLINKSGWYGGHSMWVYSLYSGGLLFGWIIIAISFLSLFRIMAVVNKKHLNNDHFLKSNAPLLLFLILGYISQGFTSDPLSKRFFALIAGLVFGMIHWFYDYYQLSNKLSYQLNKQIM
jgi:hypothetical protein